MPLSWGWQSEGSWNKASKVTPIIHTTLVFQHKRVWTLRSAESLHGGHFDLAAQSTPGLNHWWHISVLTCCHLLLILWKESTWLTAAFNAITAEWSAGLFPKTVAADTALQLMFSNTPVLSPCVVSERCFELKFFSRISSKTACLNLCASNSKGPDSLGWVEKLIFNC